MPIAWAWAMSLARLMVLPKAMRSAAIPSPRQRSISPREAQSNWPPRAPTVATTSGAGLAFTA